MQTPNVNGNNITKNIDNFGVCGRINMICKSSAEERILAAPSERGDGEGPLRGPAFSHVQAARDDRDGCSRYRASKMRTDVLCVN